MPDVIAIRALYVALVSRSKWLRQHWILGGLAAGPVIFAVMDIGRAAVACGQGAFHAGHIVPNLAAMMLFGLIIAFFTRGALI